MSDAFQPWRSALDEGSVSLITIDPGDVGFEFVIGQKDGKRVLIPRDGQHEYFFVEASSS